LKADGLAHQFDDFRKFIRANVRMGIHQNIGARPKGHQQIHDTLHIAALFGTGIEFSIRIRSGPTFTKTVITIRIYTVVDGDCF
jgi:hypothetical protein